MSVVPHNGVMEIYTTTTAHDNCDECSEMLMELLYTVTNNPIDPGFCTVELVSTDSECRALVDIG